MKVFILSVQLVAVLVAGESCNGPDETCRNLIASAYDQYGEYFYLPEETARNWIGDGFCDNTYGWPMLDTRCSCDGVLDGGDCDYAQDNGWVTVLPQCENDPPFSTPNNVAWCVPSTHWTPQELPPPGALELEEDTLANFMCAANEINAWINTLKDSLSDCLSVTTQCKNELTEISALIGSIQALGLQQICSDSSLEFLLSEVNAKKSTALTVVSNCKNSADLNCQVISSFPDNGLSCTGCNKYCMGHSIFQWDENRGDLINPVGNAPVGVPQQIGNDPTNVHCPEPGQVMWRDHENNMGCYEWGPDTHWSGAHIKKDRFLERFPWASEACMGWDMYSMFKAFVPNWNEQGPTDDANNQCACTFFDANGLAVDKIDFDEIDQTGGFCSLAEMHGEECDLVFGAYGEPGGSPGGVLNVGNAGSGHMGVGIANLHASGCCLVGTPGCALDADLTPYDATQHPYGMWIHPTDENVDCHTACEQHSETFFNADSGFEGCQNGLDNTEIQNLECVYQD